MLGWALKPWAILTSGHVTFLMLSHHRTDRRDRGQWARRNVRGGRFGIRTMFSTEPWTVSSCGSLSFLTTGELCQGDTIHDRQQHDLFMEGGRLRAPPCHL
jgi:hypothetical protein